MKKTKILLTLFLLIALITTISSAAYADVTMSVIKEPTATINYGDNSIVERSVISKDLDNKEITLQLKVTNNEGSSKPTGEVMLVLDNSKSMIDNKVTADKTRKEFVTESAKTLITNLLKDNTKLKIGVVSFSTATEVSNEGTEKDANLVSALSNDADTLNTAISNIEYTGPRTDLQAGINLAKSQFTSDTDKAHKYIIVLSDGVPNVALNYNKQYYSDDVITKTKTELQSLSSVSDNIYIMLTGITDGDAVANPSTKTYNQIVEEIFGTQAKPTIGNFYYISDDKITDTITNIYKALLPISKSITNINVKDYFTDEFVKNFDFSYVKEPNIGTIFGSFTYEKEPNIGTISDKIDTTTNSITWTIPELKSGETAIVQYKLKLKTNYDTNIVNKVLDTNTKLDVTYTDSDNKTDTKSTDITPQVKLTEKLPTVLPKAGSTIFFSFMGIVLVIAVACGIKYVVVKNSMK